MENLLLCLFVWMTQTSLPKFDIELADINGTIHNICSNSVFGDKDDTELSDYYTMDHRWI